MGVVFRSTMRCSEKGSGGCDISVAEEQNASQTAESRRLYLERQRRYNQSAKGLARYREYERRKLGWYDEGGMATAPLQVRRIS